jgi:hypothetical protein
MADHWQSYWSNPIIRPSRSRSRELAICWRGYITFEEPEDNHNMAQAPKTARHLGKPDFFDYFEPHLRSYPIDSDVNSPYQFKMHCCRLQLLSRRIKSSRLATAIYNPRI